MLIGRLRILSAARLAGVHSLALSLPERLRAHPTSVGAAHLASRKGSTLNSVRFAFCAITLTAVFAANAQAQDISVGPQRVITALPSLVNTNERGPIGANAQVIAPVSLAPAPGLTSVRVYAVGSTSCGWEYINGSGTTTCNHGGAELRVAVMEIGYGSNPIASMNGGQLPRSARYASTGICITGTQYTWPCTAGQTIVGWLDEYNVDGHDSGLFKYQNTSTNAPHNTVYTQINVL